MLFHLQGPGINRKCIIGDSQASVIAVINIAALVQSWRGCKNFLGAVLVEKLNESDYGINLLFFQEQGSCSQKQDKGQDDQRHPGPFSGRPFAALH